MLKTLKYSTLVVMLASIFVLIIEIMKVIGTGISQPSLTAVNLIRILLPNYQDNIDQILSISNDAMMIILGFIISILVVFMLFSIIGCIINYSLVNKQVKKTITIGKMLSIILIDLAVVFFVFSSKTTWILSNINPITFSTIILMLLFIAHAIFSTIVLSKFINDNLKEEILKVQLQNVYKYSVRIIAFILIVYFLQKIAFVLIINVIVDTFLRSIDVSYFASEIILGGINFSKSLSEMLPANLIDFATQFNIPLSLSLDSLGINQQVVETLLSVSVYAPLNEAIFNFLNGFTNSFIFKDFIHLIIGFGGSIAMMSISILRIPKALIKQIALVTIELILIIVVLLSVYSLAIIVVLVLILVYDVVKLICVIKHKIQKKILT